MSVTKAIQIAVIGIASIVRLAIAIEKIDGKAASPMPRSAIIAPHGHALLRPNS